MPHSNVYIRGVPVGFDTEDLRYLFEGYGTIVSAKILEPRHIGDKRLGFVKFGDEIEAHNAIAAMDKRVIAGQSLEVREAEFDVDPKKNLLDKAVIENDNLFVRGFPSYWGADELTKYFSQVGIVVSVRLLSCTMPARGGVGLVRYSTVDQARDAIAQLNDTSVDGFGPISVKYSTVKEPKCRIRRPPFRKNVVCTSLAYRNLLMQRTAPWLDSVNNDDFLQIEKSIGDLTPFPKAVLVCNLPPKMTELILYQEFAPYGAISSINIGMDESKEMCTGMAFVNFIDGNDAHRAAGSLHGTVMDGASISVVVTNN